MNQLSADKKALVIDGLRSGLSVREVARNVGVSKITVGRYRRILAEQVICECGLDVTHQGWCAPRFRRHPKRQKFVRNWWRRKIRNSEAGIEVMSRLAAQVDSSIRGEVLSEIYMRIASGEYALTDTKAVLADAKRLAAKMARGGWREQFSLDRKLTDDGATLLDFAASESLTPEEELCELEEDAA